MSKIVVTGIGIISPLGNSLHENRTALQQGKCALGSMEFTPSLYASKLPFGEVKWSNAALAQKHGISQLGITRTTLLALEAFEQAVKDAQLSTAELQTAAFINGTTVGGMCASDTLYQDANVNEVGSDYLNAYDLGSVALFIQNKYGIKGITNTFNTACSSSANAIMYGARLLQHGLAERVVVGGAESLAKFTINGFNSLNILSAEVCRPFDAERNGLNLGEGAAYLVLEKEENCKGKEIYAQVSGWANTNDAFHPSSLSDEGEGPFLAMQKALAVAQLEPVQIDFVNTHGTGTENNDEAESSAMLRVFANVPPFASAKSNIGHTLGAAGAIEAVICLLSIKYQEIYASLHFKTPIPATRLVPVLQYTKASVSHVMSNSFGFGGNCSSLVFSK